MIGGQALYGMTDSVPGILHVATQFGHIMYFPLIPMQSFIVLEGRTPLPDIRKPGMVERVGLSLAGHSEGSPIVGLRIPLNKKSMLLAWVRAVLAVLAGFCVLLPLAGGIAGIIDYLEGKSPYWRMELVLLSVALVLISPVFYVGWLLTYRWSFASRQRALDLAASAGVSELTIEDYFARRSQPR